MGGDVLDFTGDGGGTCLRLRVSAGASRSRVLGSHGGALKLSVKAPPERGKANREVLALVAEAFGLETVNATRVGRATDLRRALTHDELILIGDFGGGGDQLAQHRALAHDVRIGPKPCKAQGAIEIPQSEVVGRMAELPRDRLLVLYCWETWCSLAVKAAVPIITR